MRTGSSPLAKERILWRTKLIASLLPSNPRSGGESDGVAKCRKRAMRLPRVIMTPELIAAAGSAIGAVSGWPSSKTWTSGRSGEILMPEPAMARARVGFLLRNVSPRGTGLRVEQANSGSRRDSGMGAEPARMHLAPTCEGFGCQSMVSAGRIGLVTESVDGLMPTTVESSRLCESSVMPEIWACRAELQDLMIWPTGWTPVSRSCRGFVSPTGKEAVRHSVRLRGVIQDHGCVPFGRWCRCRCGVAIPAKKSPGDDVRLGFGPGTIASVWVRTASPRPQS